VSPAGLGQMALAGAGCAEHPGVIGPVHRWWRCTWGAGETEASAGPEPDEPPCSFWLATGAGSPQRHARVFPGHRRHQVDLVPPPRRNHTGWPDGGRRSAYSGDRRRHLEPSVGGGPHEMGGPAISWPAIRRARSVTRHRGSTWRLSTPIFTLSCWAFARCRPSAGGAEPPPTKTMIRFIDRRLPVLFVFLLEADTRDSLPRLASEL